MKKNIFLLLVSILLLISLSYSAEAQQRLKPVQPPSKISISVSPALQKQLAQIGNRILNERDFIQAANKIDRSIALRGLEAGRSMQRTKVISKQQADSFRQAMIQFYSQVDKSGLTYQIFRLAPEIAANFQFSNPEYLKLEKQIMQRHNLTITRNYEADISALASKVDNTKQQFFSKAADPMTQLAPMVNAMGGSGGPLLSGICNFLAFIDAVKAGNASAAAIAALSLLLLGLGLAIG
jgi:hypothetical protein